MAKEGGIKRGHGTRATRRSSVFETTMQRNRKHVKYGKMAMRDRKRRRRQSQINIEEQTPYLGCFGWTFYKLSVAGKQVASAFWSFVSNPWVAGSLRAVASKGGTAVSSFFELYAFLFKLNFVFALFWSCLVVLPMALENIYSRSSNVDDDIDSGGFADSIVGMLIAGTGSFRTSILFYGHYVSSNVLSNYDLPLAYFGVMIATFFVTLVVLVYKLGRLYRRDALFRSNDQETRIGTQVLSAWDHTITSSAGVLRHKSRCTLLCRELYDEYLRRLNQQIVAPKIWGVIPSPRSSFGRLTLTISMTLLFLGGVATGTYFLQVFQQTEARGGSSGSYWRELLPPFICTVGAWIIPVAQQPFRAFTLFKSSLTRLLWDVSVMFFATAGFVGIYLSTFTVHHDPGTHACWETRTAQELYRLVVFDAVFRTAIDLLWLMLVPLWTRLMRRLREKRGPEAKYMGVKTNTVLSSDLPRINVGALFVGAAYTQGLLWIGFPFVPLLPAISLGMSVVRFYTKQAIVLYAAAPPTHVIRLSQQTYVRATLITYFLATAFGCLIIFTRQPGNCGPFQSTGSRIFHIVKQRVDGDKGLARGWDYFFLRGAAVPIIFALCLAVLYLSYRFRAKRLLVEEMQYTLDREQAEFRKLLRQKHVVLSEPHKHLAKTGGVGNDKGGVSRRTHKHSSHHRSRPHHGPSHHHKSSRHRRRAANVGTPLSSHMAAPPPWQLSPPSQSQLGVFTAQDALASPAPPLLWQQEESTHISSEVWDEDPIQGTVPLDMGDHGYDNSQGMWNEPILDTGL